MARNSLTQSVLLAVTTILIGAKAEDIRGTVIIKQRLTRQRVTAAPTLYQRGPAVALHSDRPDDPLAAERARVVIYVDGHDGTVPPAQGITAKMEQKDRRFLPELLVVPVGSTVSFPNLDPIFHNVFSLSKAKSFDLGNYPKDHTRTVTFAKPGIEFINCHLHPNMSAAIVVTPNQWGTTADGAGKFVLRGVPPGPYTVVAWHKAAGYFRKVVQVLPNRGAEVEFFVPLGENVAENTVISTAGAGNTRVEARR